MLNFCRVQLDIDNIINVDVDIDVDVDVCVSTVADALMPMSTLRC